MMELERLQPQLFKEFQHILTTDRMNHAYLFSGDFASFEMALYLAQSRFCENLQHNLPCGQCRECQLIAQNEFSDVTVLKPTGNVIKTDTVREMMQNFSRSGFEGKSQVFIIQNCEKMHTNAANSLLKFIEEPQSSSYMILLTSDENKVLPTIKSRTQIFRFPKNHELLVNQAEQAGLLKNQADVFADLAKSPAHLAELMANKKNLDLLQASERLLSVLVKDKALAYLEAARLAQQTTEKPEQELVFNMLTLLMGRDLSRQSVSLLQALYRAQAMWKSNVSFQNAIEYMVIS